MAIPSIMAAVACLGYTNPGRRFYASIAAPYPEEWLRVKPGMTSDEARNVAGPPSSDGRLLKALDRREITRNGVELHLDIWFGFHRENDGDSVITGVHRWKRVLLPGVPVTDEFVDPPLP